jgi:hypothetical protein
MSNNTNTQAIKSTPTAPAAPAVEQVKPITPTEAIAAVAGQIAADGRVTAYQITEMANVVLQILGSPVKLAPQPTYNATKALWAAAKVETGEQAIKRADAITVMEKLVKKAMGGAVVQGERLDYDAIKQNALKQLGR